MTTAIPEPKPSAEALLQAIDDMGNEFAAMDTVTKMVPIAVLAEVLRRARELSASAPAEMGYAVWDSNVVKVIRKHAERAAVVLRKYGVTTERGDLSRADWLRNLQEELMDAAVYIEAALSADKAAQP